LAFFDARTRQVSLARLWQTSLSAGFARCETQAITSSFACHDVSTYI
jgi:hypothetical protein